MCVCVRVCVCVCACECVCACGIVQVSHWLFNEQLICPHTLNPPTPSVIESECVCVCVTEREREREDIALSIIETENDV